MGRRDLLSVGGGWSSVSRYRSTEAAFFIAVKKKQGLSDHQSGCEETFGDVGASMSTSGFQNPAKQRLFGRSLKQEEKDETVRTERDQRHQTDVDSQVVRFPQWKRPVGDAFGGLWCFGPPCVEHV